MDKRILILKKLSNPDKLKEFYDTVLYGFLDRKTGKRSKKDSAEDWDNLYKLNTPELTYTSRVGNCYDTAELSDYILNHYNIPHEKYHFRYREDDISDLPVATHTAVIYKLPDKKWHWLLGSWGPFKNNTISSNKKKLIIKIIAQAMANDTGHIATVRKILKSPKYLSSMALYLNKVKLNPIIMEVSPENAYT